MPPTSASTSVARLLSLGSDPSTACSDSGDGPAAMSQIAASASTKPAMRNGAGMPSRTLETAAGIAAASNPLSAAEPPIAPRARAM